ncbi:type II secretion system protein [Candidatus Saccharibacteria bacterium]|nr:type II secretion system protein [Candidatus Saccharibacteria bacterium]
MIYSNLKKSGFSLVEVVLAIAVFALIGSIVVSAFVYGRQATQQAGDRSRAAELSSETLEAVRNISNPNYSNLSSYTNGTTYYLAINANQWQLTTTPTTIDNFTRTVVFSDGPNGSRQANTNITWQITPLRTGSVSAITYFANWRQPTAASSKSGLFVYADGGTTTDSAKYRQLQTDGTWTTATTMPDFDTTTTNRVVRSMKGYSAQSGSAKMILSRHFDGTKQYMYATYWNGTSFTAPQLLAQWTSNTFVDVGNYSGDWLANGSFVAVYSNGSNSPQSRSFNGLTWSAQLSIGTIGTSTNFPSTIVAKARKNTNELMMATLMQDYSVETSYYANNAWSGYTLQTNNSIGNGTRLVSFGWNSQNTTTGELVFTNSPNDRSLRARTFTADGAGSGSWAPVANSDNLPTGVHVASLYSTPRAVGGDESIACDKGDNTPTVIYCYKLIPGSNGYSSPTNQIITTNTVPGGQITFDLAYRYLSSNLGLILYSDNTTSGKIKRFNTTTNTWDQNPIVLPNATGIIQKTKIIGRPNSDEAMSLVADSNLNLYSVVLNGTNETLYSTPAGKAWTIHNTHGPTNNAVWFDFMWDN